MNASSSFPVSLLITILALALVLLLAWFAIKALSRFGGTRPGQGRVHILQSLAVGSRERLLLVRFDNSDYLLGVSAGGVTLIDRQTADSDDARNDGDAGGR